MGYAIVAQILQVLSVGAGVLCTILGGLFISTVNTVGLYVICIYLLLVGFIIILLELHNLYADKQFEFLFHYWGRGAFYFLFGPMCFLFNEIGFGVGITISFIGLLYIILGLCLTTMDFPRSYFQKRSKSRY